MSDQIPGNILNLIAGQGRPAPGPDWNAVQNNQKMAIALQQAQQVQQAQNALKSLYAQPRNFDANTLRPTPEAMSSLMAASPAAGMDLQNNLAAIQQKKAQTDLANSEAMQGWMKSMWEVGDNAAIAYNAAVQKGNPNAQQIGQEEYSKGIEAQRAAGNPLATDPRVSPSFDIMRIRQRQNAQIANKFETKTDYGTQPPTEYRLYGDGRTTDITGAQPYRPTGIAKVERSETPELYTGTDENGKQVTVRPGAGGGFYDFTTGEPRINLKNIRKIGTKAETDADMAMTPTGPPELHGSEYLAALPPSRAALIQGYAEGRIPIPSSFALGKPAWEKVLADLNQYDPTFDAINYQSRYRTRQDFTSGKSAQNITSFNTAIGHLGTLQSAANGLGNSWSPLYNTIANFVESARGNPRIVRFETAKQAVADELTRAFRGTGGNVSDIKDWEKNLNAANSPEQLKAAIEQAVNLLGSRIESVGEQYRRGMGTTADVTELLTDAAKRTLADLPRGQEILNDAGMRPQGTRGAPAATLGGPSTSAPTSPTSASPAPGSAAPAFKQNAQGVVEGVTVDQAPHIPSGMKFRLTTDPPGVVRTQP
jgi:hypothetical protein